MKNARYTLLVLDAYEGEVAGSAYFEGLALMYPQQSSFCQRCAALERTTADRLLGLVRKYQLTPATPTALHERGALDARIEAPSDWRTLMRQSIRSYARYVEEFRTLEAMGPAEDQPILAALTVHEVQLIEWMRTEIGF